MAGRRTTRQRATVTSADEVMEETVDPNPSSTEGASSNDATSDATISDEANPLGAHVKEAIATISKLEGLGLQRQSIPLPKCVVLGEQSTGKSSVIEAISGIKTPRSTDTCTRCPLFIKLEPCADPSTHWKAEVSIRRAFDYDGKNGRGRERRFRGWVQVQTPVDVAFATLTSPAELEYAISRAQLAVLCHLENPGWLLDPAAQIPDLVCGFSPNVICINITHPSLPALSFYDLPGIIGQAEDEDSEFLVQFVRDLVTEYIQDPDSLILNTCSLENDIANSTATGIARDLKAKDRCIGVLTKPDRLPPGSRDERLQAVLEGARFALGHGYFVVKNLGQDEINQGLSHHEARLREDRFFATPPWSTIFSDYQLRFGTTNLQTYISKTLAAQISRKLPIIHEEIEARLQDVETQLARLPEPPPTYSASRIISDIMIAFSDVIRKEMEGEHPFNEWRNIWEALRKAFYEDIMSMKPTLSTSGSLDEGIFLSTMPGNSIDCSICVDSDTEDDQDSEMPETPSKKRKVDTTPASSTVNTPSKISKTPSKMLDLPKRPRTKPPPPPAEDSNFAQMRKVFRLDSLSTHLSQNSKSKVPDKIHPKVIDDLMLSTMNYWHLPMDKFFTSFEKELSAHVESKFRDHFGPWKGSKLYEEASIIVNQMLNINFNLHHKTMAVDSLRDESEGPYIYHKSLLQEEQTEVLKIYRQARFNARLRIYGKEWGEHTNKEFTKQEEEKIRKDPQKRSIIEKDPYEELVKTVAQVTAYNTIAARRFHDSVCIRIESNFFRQLRTGLRDELDNQLGIHGPEGPANAMRLLAEPPDRARDRKELLARKEALLEGMQCLRDLQNKYEDCVPPRTTANSAFYSTTNGAANGNINGDLNGNGSRFNTPSFPSTPNPFIDKLRGVTPGNRTRR